jgi:hypothetical protein
LSSKRFSVLQNADALVVCRDGELSLLVPPTFLPVSSFLLPSDPPSGVRQTESCPIRWSAPVSINRGGKYKSINRGRKYKSINRGGKYKSINRGGKYTHALMSMDATVEKSHSFERR